MKLARAIKLDSSDAQVFRLSARPGEWSISGSFEFSNWSSDDITGKERQAFTNGWLGLETFGRSTFIAVTPILKSECDDLTKALAQKFVNDHGAPSIAAAYPVAKDEIEYMLSMCEEHPTNTILVVTRELTDAGIHEQFRHFKSDAAVLDVFAVHGSADE
ncbi:MAG: DUF6505 family protein [Pseudomonadota bacterium]|nr:DUF6505 family protein [Pseudomonadota bacterium]